jgi:F-type H+-transporting ATPase subunit epsilon
MALKCRVVTPDRAYFDGVVTSVVVPAIDGELGIFPRHAALIAQLGYGVLRLALPGGTTKHIALYAGFVMVQNDEVTVLAGGADDAEEIEAAAAKAELEQAKATQLQRRVPHVSEVEAEEVTAALARARARVRATS